MSDARSLLKDYLAMDMFRYKFPVDFEAEWMMIRIENTYVPGGTIVDLGGGASPVNAVLADLGMNVHCIDLMRDYYIHHGSKRDPKTRQFEFLKDKGVHYIHHDLLTYQFDDFAPGSCDVICSYHCFEHLHHSPRLMVNYARKALKDKGILFLEVPNAVNLLKRIKVLFGKTNYSTYDEYFDFDQYVGHIREYTVGDLERLAEKSGFKDYEIFGRNFYGTLYERFNYHFPAALIDHCLRLKPGLCGALHFKAFK